MCYPRPGTAPTLLVRLGLPPQQPGSSAVAYFYIILWSIGILLALVLDVQNDGTRF